MRVSRVLAPNPGPFTGSGTNTYVVGDETGVIVVDPGPVDTGHAQAIVDQVGSVPVDAVVVTHTHIDHAPLANPLAAELGVPALGHAPGPEFEPDVLLVDGSIILAGAQTLQAIHTPGHADDHLCFLAGRTLFTGDHIMGGSSVMVDDLAPYLDSLRRLQSLDLDTLLPGHGDEMDSPGEVISWYLAHRLERERQIIEAIVQGVGTVGSIVETIYKDVDPSLYPMAARSVIAHLRKLADEGMIRVDGHGWDSRVSVISAPGTF